MFLRLNWIPEEVSRMCVDTSEEKWYCVNDIWLNGQVCCQHCCSSLIITSSIHKFIMLEFNRLDTTLKINLSTTSVHTVNTH